MQTPGRRRRCGAVGCATSGKYAGCSIARSAHTCSSSRPRERLLSRSTLRPRRTPPCWSRCRPGCAAPFRAFARGPRFSASSSASPSRALWRTCTGAAAWAGPTRGCVASRRTRAASSSLPIICHPTSGAPRSSSHCSPPRTIPAIGCTTCSTARSEMSTARSCGSPRPSTACAPTPSTTRRSMKRSTRCDPPSCTTCSSGCQRSHRRWGSSSSAHPRAR